MFETPVTEVALDGFTKEMKDYFITESLVRKIYYKTRQGTKVLERNTQYEEGETVYSELIPEGYKLICVQSGVSGMQEPVELR